MERPPTPLISLAILLTALLSTPYKSLSLCSNKCGSLQVRYPFGTGYGCGSPSFYPSITCTSTDGNGNEDRLTLTTHTGTYPITSISYSTSTLTVSPPLMSTCSSMHPSAPKFGLDWSSPFQLGPSLFVLLSCPPPTSSLSYRGTLICDASSTPRLCASLHACPSVLSLGLPIFAPTNTCCVYSPANLGPKGGELDLQGLGCSAYTSVVSLGLMMPTDPSTWEYGVELKYGQVGLVDDDGVAEACGACEGSGGVCGYEPPRNYFICVCNSGVNTSTDCAGQDEELREYYSHSSGNAVVMDRYGILSLSKKVALGCLWLVMEGSSSFLFLWLFFFIVMELLL